MPVRSEAAPIYRFGMFELDSRSAELRRNGSRLKIQEQPLQVLLKLLEHPGEVVSREELRASLWPADTFVDFETGLNTVIKRLRETLGDSAETPIFIETIPRRGYRFVGTVDIKPRGLPPGLVPQKAPIDIQTTYHRVIERGLSARMVRYTHAVLRSAPRQACDDVCCSKILSMVSKSRSSSEVKCVHSQSSRRKLFLGLLCRLGMAPCLHWRSPPGCGPVNIWL